VHLASAAIFALQVMAVLRVVVLLISPASAEPIQPGDVRVNDGDTIRVHHKRPDVRLVGFTAPATRRALCQARRQPGGFAS
jgi:endonuclease YncB( thermonuclease family)